MVVAVDFVWRQIVSMAIDQGSKLAKILGASWLPNFSIWEPGTIFRGQLATIDLITQHGCSPSGDHIFQSGRQWVKLVAFGDPQVATLSPVDVDLDLWRFIFLSV